MYERKKLFPANVIHSMQGFPIHKIGQPGDPQNESYSCIMKILLNALVRKRKQYDAVNSSSFIIFCMFLFDNIDTLLFGVFFGCRGFCHIRAESDIFSFFSRNRNRYNIFSTIFYIRLDNTHYTCTK